VDINKIMCGIFLF